MMKVRHSNTNAYHMSHLHSFWNFLQGTFFARDKKGKKEIMASKPLKFAMALANFQGSCQAEIVLTTTMLTFG